MKLSQTLILGGMLLVAVAAIIGGQFAIQLHFAKKPQASIKESNAEDQHAWANRPPASAFENPPANSRRVGRSLLWAPGAKVLSDSDPFQLDEISTDSDDPKVKLIAGEQNKEDASAKSNASQLSNSDVESGSAPEKLTAPQDATPIDTPTSQADAQTKIIIKHELPDASEEEREIWLDALRGMPSEMTREILRLKKTIGPIGLPNIAKLPADSELNGHPPRLAPDNLIPHFIPNVDISREADYPPVPAIDTAITALETARDVILNNIANAGTTSFKRERVILSDLEYQHFKLPGQKDQLGNLSPIGIHVGFGVQVLGVRRELAPGHLVVTDNDLDLAIIGNGYFQIQAGEQIVYSRAGRFTKNADGDIVLACAKRGLLLEPPIQCPQDLIKIVISREGLVSVLQAGSNTLTDLGTIQIARFINPAGLIPLGDNLFAANDASGTPLIGQPGIDGRGTLKQSCLETSNVDLRQELAELKRIQRQLQAVLAAREIIARGIIPEQRIIHHTPLPAQSAIGPKPLDGPRTK